MTNPPKRIGPILWRLEKRWEENPDLSLKDLLRKVGNGSIPDDRELIVALRADETA